MGDNVVRYDISYDSANNADFVIDKEGGYVSYYDYKELLDKFNKALRELEGKNDIKMFDWRYR